MLTISLILLQIAGNASRWVALICSTRVVAPQTASGNSGLSSAAVPVDPASSAQPDLAAAATTASSGLEDLDAAATTASENPCRAGVSDSHDLVKVVTSDRRRPVGFLGRFD